MSLRDLYADNGADGDNIRLPDGTTLYDIKRMNPVYCVYGYAHRPVDGKCVVCQAPDTAG